MAIERSQKHICHRGAAAMAANERGAKIMTIAIMTFMGAHPSECLLVSAPTKPFVPTSCASDTRMVAGRPAPPGR